MPTTVFTLKPYLARLETMQSVNPTKSVPSHADLAELLGMDVTAFSRMINNRTRMIDRNKLGVIIAELRRRGFDTRYDDVLALSE